MRRLDCTYWIGSISMILLLAAASALTAGESHVSTNGTPTRIGIYDSRGVAYAWFWSKEHQAQLEQQRRAVKAAQGTHDTNRVATLGQALAKDQQTIHQQVFSTAPATEALEAIQKRLPDLQKQAGVSMFISKWDERSLEPYKSAVQVDVTDLLVKEFNPNEKQLSVIQQIRSKPPSAGGKFD